LVPNMLLIALKAGCDHSLLGSRLCEHAGCASCLCMALSACAAAACYAHCADADSADVLYLCV
jgi:hypothetical protein